VSGFPFYRDVHAQELSDDLGVGEEMRRDFRGVKLGDSSGEGGWEKELVCQMLVHGGRGGEELQTRPHRFFCYLFRRFPSFS
jgi:hypothetical protein